MPAIIPVHPDCNPYPLPQNVSWRAQEIFFVACEPWPLLLPLYERERGCCDGSASNLRVSALQNVFAPQKYGFQPHILRNAQRYKSIQLAMPFSKVRPSFGISKNRPLRRQLIKVMCNFLGRRWSHTHAWAPYLRLTRNDSGSLSSIVYRGHTVAPLSPSSILAKGTTSRKIYIVGSGPSVAENDLTQLEPQSCLLLNGAIAEIGSAIEKPLAIAVEDERFVWRHFAMLTEKVPPGTICLLSVAVIRAICEQNPAWLGQMQVVLIDDIRKPYGAPRPLSGDLKSRVGVSMNTAGSAGISRDPDRGVFQGGSVAISAFQFAIYAQPKLIGLVGVDISNADRPRFYERSGKTAPSGLRSASDRILDHLKLAIEDCNARCIRLHNYSRQSILLECGLPYNSRLRKGFS